MLNSPTTLPFGSTPLATPVAPSATGQTLPFGSKPIAAPTQIPDEIENAVATPFEDVASNFVSGIKQFGTGFQQIQKGTSQGVNMNQNDTTTEGINAPGGSDIGRGLLNEGAGGILAFSAPLTGLIKSSANIPGIKQAIQAVKQYVTDPASDAISNVPALQEFMTKYPNADEVAANLMTIGLTLYGGDKTGEIKDSLNNSLATPEGAAETPSTSGPTTRTPDEQAEIQSVADDWQKPATQPTGFVKAKAVLAKTPETPTFLAEQGLNPFEHIVEGKYDTEATAQNLRDTAGQLSKDGLRPSLEIADASTPKTAVSEIQAPSVSNVNNEFAVTPDDSEAIQSKITSKIDALGRKYPDGMSLTNMHDEKINFSKNGGFSPVGDPSVTNNAIANRAISSSLEDMVEAKAPPELPVGDFNGELSKFYKAADYLDELQGKKAPVSTATKVVRYISKIAGAKIAGLTGGGDIVSELVGYKIGGALERFAENLTNPMRDSFLRNLQKTNPEAFTKVSDFLVNEEVSRANRLALPSGTENGIPKVIIVGPKTDISGIKIVPAQNSIPERLNLPPPTPLGSSGNPIITPSPTTFESAAGESKLTTFNKKTGFSYVRDLKTGKVKVIPPNE